MSKGFVSKLLARYRAEGEAAFEPRSRRPHSNPNRVSDVVNDLIVNLRDQLSAQGLDGGPVTIQWHLKHDHNIGVSVSTIRRRLIASGRVTPQPHKRPRSSYLRFEADLPNGMWQSDVTHYFLGPPEPDQSNRVEILTWLDDHSRYALTVTAHTTVKASDVTKTLQTAGKHYGLPASVLTDNALIYTTRFAGGKGGRNHLETFCATNHIHQKNSAPHHPTTCGKVERFQQTLKKWLRAQPNQPSAIDELQTLLDQFVAYYNHHRPHRANQRRTPAIAYTALPKDQPHHDAPTHHRIRRDKVDTTGRVTLRHNGRLHHIGIGRRHTGTPVTLIIADLDIRIIVTETGQLLRHLTLNPERDYQPQKPETP